MQRNAANALSLSRVPAAFALLLIYDLGSRDRLVASLGIAFFVALSDVLDGKLARTYNNASKLGYVLDGLGDRAFHVAIYLVFVLNGILFAPLAWLLIFREVLQYAVRLVEEDWHANQSALDRFIAKSYTVALQAVFIEVTCASILCSGPVAPLHRSFVSATFLLLSLLSYSRIVPRLWRAWVSATHD
jgi:phosphatidylglycerophosphate synthase